MQVPANRIGHVSNGGPFAAPQLKVITELLSLSAFSVFSSAVLKEKLRWTDGLGFVFILLGVIIAMAGRHASQGPAGAHSPDLELLIPPPPPPPPSPSPVHHG
jgi:drug/metabolite transporter (DMT)-like permease